MTRAIAIKVPVVRRKGFNEDGVAVFVEKALKLIIKIGSC
jgi:hypothetical protein